MAHHQTEARGEPRSIQGGKVEAVRVWLLGGFRVSVGSRTIEGGEWQLKKAGSLVKLLALARGHRLHRERIMDTLWPDLDEKSASNNLHRVLHAIRRALDPATENATARYLSLQGDLVELSPDGPIWVDVEAFEGAAANARRSREPAAYRAAVELYVGTCYPRTSTSRGRRRRERSCDGCTWPCSRSLPPCTRSARSTCRPSKPSGGRLLASRPTRRRTGA